LPTSTALPVNSQRRAMAEILTKPDRKRQRRPRLSRCPRPEVARV